MLVSALIGFAALVVLVVILRWGRAWWTWRGDRVVTCPENHQHAGVKVDALHAASGLRLATCSRWPEKAGCGQECLRDIAAAPADCLVRNIAAKWYEGKSCASCGRPIGRFEWGPNQPALVSADKTSVEWKQVPAEHLYETLEAAVPVCFACHMANTLVREHPEIAIERNRRPSL
ncbi:MAG TPA: hypothetical protein VMJ75_15600 [Candidatus Acidoferrales bacterium]|nr:hypothetical protein [Candidatus Acidoferrales bacterium]